MRLACDANVRHSFYNVLQQDGHDVVRTRYELEAAATDEAIVEFCRERERVLLTTDTDFFDFEETYGVLFLTAQTVSERRLATAIRRIELAVDPTSLSGTVLHVPGGWARSHPRTSST